MIRFRSGTARPSCGSPAPTAAGGECRFGRLCNPAIDGIAVVGGSTASALLGIGDLELSPYRLYAPRRVNARNPSASFARRAVARDEVTFEQGLPVTRPERTVFDLVVDDEDLSLVADVLGDASLKYPGFDYGKLRGLLEGRYGGKRGRGIFNGLMEDSRILGD